MDRFSTNTATLTDSTRAGGTFNFNITGLASSTSYDVKCKATNASGQIVATAKTFSTNTSGTVSALAVTGAAPTNITAASADIKCNVTTNGQQTDVWAVWDLASKSVLANTTQHALQPAASGTQTVTYTLSGLTASTSYKFPCKADRDGDGLNPTVAAALTFATVAASANVVIAASGDICDPDPLSCSNAADLIGFQNPDYFLSLGDNQYESAITQELLNGFDKTYGLFKNKIIPTIGNHEVKNNPSAPDYVSNFSTGAAHDTGPSTDFTYRKDLGKWSIISVNSNGAGAQLNSTSPRYAAVTALVDAATPTATTSSLGCITRAGIRPA